MNKTSRRSEMSRETAIKTAFYNKHLLLHAKLVEFAGYLMPIYYEGIVPEHRAVRNSVGMFDISHMGEFYVKGPRAFEFLQKMTTNDVSKIEMWQAQYSCMITDKGGIIDDILVYRLPDKFMLVVNASNIDKDYNWLKSHLPHDGVELFNATREVSLLAIQGPKAQDVLSRMTNLDLDNIEYYWSHVIDVAGERILVSRTGYTGEDGFELYMKNNIAEKLWDATLEAGEKENIVPIGLGARDTLRLEMKYMLYGNDMTEENNPYEAGLGWIVKLEKGDFVGREALIEIKTSGIKKRCVCFELLDRGFPRQGHKVFRDNREVGEVTSGTFSPMLNKGIGLAYVPKEWSKSGNEYDVIIRNTPIPAVLVKPPFWEKGSIKSRK
jgi:aminomethyltransferase